MWRDRWGIEMPLITLPSSHRGREGISIFPVAQRAAKAGSDVGRVGELGELISHIIRLKVTN